MLKISGYNHIKIHKPIARACFFCTRSRGVVPTAPFSVDRLFYQRQKNGTLHLVQVSPNGGKKYVKYVSGLKIPIVKSFHKTKGVSP